MLSKYLIVADVDGTLLPQDKKLPRRTVEAVRRFIAGGGNFSLDTGRVHQGCRELLEELGIRIPSVHCNGAYLYDPASDREIESTYLPREARARLFQAAEAFPDICLATFDPQGRFVRLNWPKVVTPACRWCENLPLVREEDVPGEWYKALLFREPEGMEELHAYLDAHPLPGSYYVNSDASLCEVMAKGVSKGGGLQKLARVMGIPIENTFALGDYFNDVSMFEAAGTSVAVGDGAPEILDMCDMRVCSCADGAAADLIEYLEKREGLR